VRARDAHDEHGNREHARQAVRVTHRDGAISKTFTFPNYWQTMAFVNATAGYRIGKITIRSGVGYNQCRVAYQTHAIKACRRMTLFVRRNRRIVLALAVMTSSEAHADAPLHVRSLHASAAARWSR